MGTDASASPEQDPTPWVELLAARRYREWYEKPANQRRLLPQRWAEGVGLHGPLKLPRRPHGPLEPPWLRVAFALASYADKHGHTNVSRRKLARVTHTRPETVQKVIETLALYSWLGVDGRDTYLTLPLPDFWGRADHGLGGVEVD